MDNVREGLPYQTDQSSQVQHHETRAFEPSKGDSFASFTAS